MKILVYETREDELDAIRNLEKELPIEIRTTSEIPSMENVSMAEGCDFCRLYRFSRSQS